MSPEPHSPDLPSNPPHPDRRTPSESGQPIPLTAGHSCQEAVTELYTYIDGALTESRRAVIQSHVEDCPPCLDQFEFHVELRAVIRTRCRTEVSLEFRERVFRQILDSGGPSESGAAS